MDLENNNDGKVLAEGVLLQVDAVLLDDDVGLGLALVGGGGDGGVEEALVVLLDDDAVLLQLLLNENDLLVALHDEVSAWEESAKGRGGK